MNSSQRVINTLRPAQSLSVSHFVNMLSIFSETEALLYAHCKAFSTSRQTTFLSANISDASANMASCVLAIKRMNPEPSILIEAAIHRF